MKKITVLIALMLSLASTLFADTGDGIVYADITSAFNTGFYPGVVEKTNLLEKNYPDSVYLNKSELMKAQALIKMYRYDEAVQVLKPLCKKFVSDSENYLQTIYFLGQAYYLGGNDEEALKNFYLVCSADVKGKENPYYAQSVYFAGNSYFRIDCFEKAKPLFEYIVQNGKNYSKNNYDESLQKLFLCYSHLENYQKAIALYNQLNKSDFDEQIYCNICLYAADSFENADREETAYKLYSSVVKAGYKTSAVIAMKKAYALAETGKIKENPADIFTQAAKTFEDSPDLVCDFWVRLGIDEFNDRNYEKSKEYFSNARHLVDEGVAYDKAILDLYKAKLYIEADKTYSDAEKLLLNIKESISSSSVEGIQDSYYSTLLQCLALEEKWDLIPQNYEQIKNPDVEAVYNYARSLYEQKNYVLCQEFLRNYLKEKVSEKNLCLYKLLAQVYIQQKVYSAAASVYHQIDLAGLLDEKNKIEYAKVLFNCCNYEDCIKVVDQTAYNQKNYIKGLCKINQRDWQNARSNFISYIKDQSKSNDFKILSYFYKGYAEYNLGNTRDAYTSFIHYAGDAPAREKKYICLAYEYGAKSALQNGDYKSAATHAETLIKICDKTEDKQNAVLLCAEIYSSIEKYDKAISVLEPYAKAHNDFAVQCLFQIAKNQEKQNKVADAEKTYTKIFTDFPESSQAEEAMYSLGGLYYSRGDFVTAENRYNNYIYKFVDGKFSDAAFFYCADSELKMGAVEKSIMMNKNLIQTYPKSIYIYGSYKNLLNGYYKTEDYNNALNIAVLMIKEYPDQAASDGIGRTVLELEQIVNGTDRKQAEKYSEYEKAGGSSTKAGRDAGTELVSIYGAQDGNGPEEAYKLACELLPKQTEPGEKYNAAKNADYIASYNRKNLENETAAQYFLKAAEYYRASGAATADETAAALYSAVEAFKAGGFDSDASDTADLLKKLYPDSLYAVRAKALVK